MSFNLSPSFEGVVAVINIPIKNHVGCTIKVVSRSVCRAWPKTHRTGLKGTITYILKVICVPVFTYNSLYLPVKHGQVLPVSFPVQCVIISMCE